MADKKQLDDLSTAFKKGRMAVIDGGGNADVDDNPYPDGAPEHEAWIEGFVDERNIHHRD